MKYIFLHIPKNGGTTLQLILDSQYRKYQIYNIPDFNREKNLLALERKNDVSKRFIKVIKGGHFSYGCHAFFKRPEQVKYFAMLRNPIDRALSYYSYVKRTTEHYLYNTFINENITFDDFIGRQDLNVEITNGQTKLIAGIEQQDECTTETFENAKAHLENSFFLVGIMEKYVETLYVLKTELGWSKPINYMVMNINRNKQNEISTAQQDKLLEMNTFDTAIYQQYSEIFEEKIKTFSLSDFNTFKNTLQN